MNFTRIAMNRKRIQVLLFFGTFLLLFSAKAQDRRNQEQIKTLKIAFFTERLNLTP